MMDKEQKDLNALLNRMSDKLLKSQLKEQESKLEKGLVNEDYLLLLKAEVAKRGL